MIIVLLATIGLVAWALHLMRKALEHREFSLMFAGFLVVSAAAALLVVYSLMGDYMGYMSHHAAIAPTDMDFSSLEDWLREQEVLM